MVSICLVLSSPFTSSSPITRSSVPPSLNRSFGVVCYEVFSYGMTPYAGRTNAEVAENVPLGLRLPQPRSCPDAVFALMVQTWAHSEIDRPVFSILAEALMDVRDRLAMGSGDADLVCSRAMMMSSEQDGAQTRYHDAGLATLSAKRKRKGQQQGSPASRIGSGCSGMPDGTNDRYRAVDNTISLSHGADQLRGAGSSGARSNAEGLRRISRISLLDHGHSRDHSGSVVNFVGGYMVLGVADQCIVLDPEGLDAQHLSATAASLQRAWLHPAAAATSCTVADHKDRRSGKAGKRPKHASKAEKRGRQANSQRTVATDLPPVVMRSQHAGEAMYHPVDLMQLDEDTLAAIWAMHHGEDLRGDDDHHLNGVASIDGLSPSQATAEPGQETDKSSHAVRLHGEVGAEGGAITNGGISRDTAARLSRKLLGRTFTPLATQAHS